MHRSLALLLALGLASGAAHAQERDWALDASDQEAYLIFGVSDINKVAIAAFGSFLIVIFNSAYGVINARKQRVMAARVMGASRWQVFKDVLVWESLQPTFVGLRSAVSMALVIVIVAEMFIGADNGLGNRIINAQQVMRVKDMYAAILSAGVMGYALNVFFLVAEKRIVHWSGR